MAQDNTLCRAYYQESYDRAKMTYSRIDLLERGPSFTQRKQIAMTRNQAIAREQCIAMIHAPQSWSCTQAARCELRASKSAVHVEDDVPVR